jgi:hypothetical protein
MIRPIAEPACRVNQAAPNGRVDAALKRLGIRRAIKDLKRDRLSSLRDACPRSEAARAGYPHAFSDAMSIENRYFTSDFKSRS